MTTFIDFLAVRLDAGGFSTEDVLTSILPLMRQAIDAHNSRYVAPLEGLNDLRVEGAAIWFEDAARNPSATNFSKIRQLDRPSQSAVEVVVEQRRTLEVGEGFTEIVDLSIGEAGAEISRPVYLPGYISWEHTVGHHDPLVDVYSLGMILASLACGLNFCEPKDVKAFVSSRDNLFRLNPGLHPVLAKAIVNMTELSRHKRPQDLRAVMRNLENYRDQEVSIDFDLASIEGFGEKDLSGKQQVILGKLQERLLEISRRNRLLHFRDTAGTVSLTEASVPLSFDVESIRTDQILTWGGKFQRDVEAGKPIPLNRYMNFREALYLGPTLDRIRAESLRDQAEFGFQQLRMVLCFLRWADVKANPPEKYFSPLVLLAAKLVKKKGVRDTYLVEPLSTVAEINPVLRHLLKQLYDIDLPETIDLDKASLDDLFKGLKAVVESSDASVTVKKIDRPRIDLIHDRARRRLDMYRRRAQVSGRGLRRFMDLDYSYDPVNFHPLGLRIFNAWIRPAETHLHSILQERPGPRQFMVPKTDAPDNVKEKKFFALRDGAGDNPFVWEFDLCRVTLGNFRYRKMTLVRDYTTLLEQPRSNEAFDAIFSLSPRPVKTEEAAAPPLAERFDIVSCDPTQAAAIQLARSGQSYIIQGPPGTGKSQTITNLIVEYVARGKRILFVCEKRAAIDVVYSRLKQRGLKELCCLIHDSQADKRAFVMDLKQTYESFIKAAGEDRVNYAQQRKRMNDVINLEAAPLNNFAQAMVSEPENAGVPVETLYRRGAELAPARPQLPALQMERVPFYASWAGSRAQISALLDKLGRIQEDLVLARHPLRLLRTGLKDAERPLEQVLTALDQAEPLLKKIVDVLGQSGLPGHLYQSLNLAAELVDFVANAQRLARQRLLRVLDPESKAGQQFSEHLRRYGKAQTALEAAREHTTHWGNKLSPADTDLALAEAKRLEGTFLAFLRPSWWRLRRILGERYQFEKHIIKLKWSHVLEALQKEHQAAAALAQVEEEMREACGIEEELGEVVPLVEQLIEETRSGEGRELLQALLNQADPDAVVQRIAALQTDMRRMEEALKSVLEDHRDCPLEELLNNLMAIRESLDDLPDFLACLTDLAVMPADLAGALRHLLLNPQEIEAAAVRRTLNAAYRTNPQLRIFNEDQRRISCRRLWTAHKKWLELNAQVVREKVRGRFLEHLKLISEPAARLTREQTGFKKRFNRGRRQLEHEFGKSMRYKSIRDLVDGESGMVVDDLKPIWLMSPLSVSDTLPLDKGRFDVVIFDEASQITLEEAVPALFRAGQAIVVGDEMQLPPTNFFSAKSGDEDGTLWLEEGEELVEYDLSVNSFLSHAAKKLPSRMLGWHYRSRSESLISFSNWAFYQGQLLTVPEEELSPSRRPEIVVKEPAEGDDKIRELLSRPVSFHRMEGAVYQNRTNRMEADYIAHLVRGILQDDNNPSIGIVAFSEAQQGKIDDALQRLGAEDASFRERLEVELTREEDGQFIGLLVKNLENIQGDERDIIIMSVCYGYNAEGKMRMNFGPINQSGGEKRLNVVFSRAKHHMALVSSIQYHDITNDYNDGANCLKNYLRYAAACSVGDAQGARRVVQDLCLWRDPEGGIRADKPGSLVKQIGEAMAGHGYTVDYSIGMSDFRCDLAVRRNADEKYRLGILVDAAPYYKLGDLIEREVFKPQLLTAFGWKIARVLAKDWYEDRAGVLKSLLAIAEGASPAEEIGIDPAFAESLEARLSESGEQTSDDAKQQAIPKAEPVAAPARAKILELKDNVPRYFEFVGGASKKFWELVLCGDRFSVRFGRIGTKGQERLKICSSHDAARRAAERMVREKLIKGYEEKLKPGKPA